MGLRNILKLFVLSSVIFVIYSFREYSYRNDLSAQLSYYKYEIANYEDRIRSNDFVISSLKNKLTDLDDQISVLSAILDKGNSTATEIKEKTYKDEAELMDYKMKLEKMRDELKKKVLWLYKAGTHYNLELLFTSKSLNELYVRLEYLNKLSKIRKKQIEHINAQQVLMEEKKNVSNLSKKEYVKYLETKQDKRKSLLTEKTATENEIKKNNRINDGYRRQIYNKKILADRIEFDLSINPEDITYKIDQNINYNGKSFSELKGSLIIPVQSVNIISDFGKAINPETRTISYNNGIDVSIAEGSEVRCTADGEVDLVDNVPYYGNIIVINHGEKFRTVYAIVKNMSVSKGQSVKAGEVIAVTANNVTGQSFHFEIWEEESPVNPKLWLKR